MRLADFKLEHFFERWEFSAPYLLSSSDAESMSLNELLVLADEESERPLGRAPPAARTALR